MTISQVTTEPELVERSTKLEEVLSNGNYIDYCRQRADETEDQHGRYVWYFLKANFEADPHAEMLNLLGKHKSRIFLSLQRRKIKYLIARKMYNYSTIISVEQAITLRICVANLVNLSRKMLTVTLMPSTQDSPIL